MAETTSSLPPEAFAGKVVPSERERGVSYRLERCVGQGGTGAAFLAMRQAPDGAAPVIVKLVRLPPMPGSELTASMLVQKEAVALGRLNERVPPTPFVVRLVDAGASELAGKGRPPIPWLAVEYVHGGIEGTTLEERVAYSLEKTGFAFDGTRAAHLARCLGSGLSAIHGVGVVHRDLTPRNVLACGFGEAEIFKISDFGIARPTGLVLTFSGGVLGTPGFAAPEQLYPDNDGGGIESDLFSFACVMYYALTGDMFFKVNTPMEALAAANAKARRSIVESQYLVPELRERRAACDAIDHALARATAQDPKERPAQPQELAQSLIPWLVDGSNRPRPSVRLISSLLAEPSQKSLKAWRWTVRHPPGDNRVIRSASWDVDGHCFAATTAGPAFWNGEAWVNAVLRELPLEGEIQFVRRISAGSWLVGGEAGTLAVHTTDGAHEVVRSTDPHVTFRHACGRFDDLLAAVGQRPDEPPTLFSMAAGRWLRPLPLAGVAFVSALLPLDDGHFVLGGRLAKGGGFAALYTPMMWDVQYLAIPRTRALISGASTPERALALLVGTDGLALRVQSTSVTASTAAGAPDLTAAAMDVLDREWIASIGRLWMRDSATDSDWKPVWQDATWKTPFISIMADTGRVVAMTADGGVLEGRAG